MSNVRGSAYLLAALGAAIWVVSLVWNPPPPPKYVGLKTVRERIPQQVQSFERASRENTFPDAVRTALASADLVSYNYSSSSGDVDLTLIGGTDRSACSKSGGANTSPFSASSP